jgi:hypothetical protein
VGQCPRSSRSIECYGLRVHLGASTGRLLLRYSGLVQCHREYRSTCRPLHYKWQRGRLHVRRSHQPDPGTDNSTQLQYWVEAGYTYGWNDSDILTHYWADNRPYYGYYDHQITAITPSIGSWVEVKISYAGVVNGTYEWDVYRNGTRYGISEDNPPYSESMVTGLETTSPNSTLADAYSNSLQYNYNGTWISDWGGATLQCNDLAEVQWVTQYAEIKDWQN